MLITRGTSTNISRKNRPAVIFVSSVVTGDDSPGLLTARTTRESAASSGGRATGPARASSPGRRRSPEPSGLRSGVGTALGSSSPRPERPARPARPGPDPASHGAAQSAAGSGLVSSSASSAPPIRPSAGCRRRSMSTALFRATVVSQVERQARPWSHWNWPRWATTDSPDLLEAILPLGGRQVPAGELGPQPGLIVIHRIGPRPQPREAEGHAPGNGTPGKPGSGRGVPGRSRDLVRMSSALQVPPHHKHSVGRVNGDFFPCLSVVSARGVSGAVRRSPRAGRFRLGVDRMIGISSFTACDGSAGRGCPSHRWLTDGSGTGLASASSQTLRLWSSHAVAASHRPSGENATLISALRCRRGCLSAGRSTPTRAGPLRHCRPWPGSFRRARRQRRASPWHCPRSTVPTWPT